MYINYASNYHLFHLTFNWNNDRKILNDKLKAYIISIQKPKIKNKYSLIINTALYIKPKKNFQK